MRRYWCDCGTTVEAEVVFRGGAYEAEFFDVDHTPTDKCPGCAEELYPKLCEGTLSDTPPERRPRALRLVSGGHR